MIITTKYRPGDDLFLKISDGKISEKIKCHIDRVRITITRSSATINYIISKNGIRTHIDEAELIKMVD